MAKKNADSSGARMLQGENAMIYLVLSYLVITFQHNESYWNELWRLICEALRGTITYPTRKRFKSSTQECQTGGDMLVPRGVLRQFRLS